METTFSTPSVTTTLSKPILVKSNNLLKRISNSIKRFFNWIYNYFFPYNFVKQKSEFRIIPDCFENWIGKVSYKSIICAWGGECKNHPQKQAIEKVTKDLLSHVERQLAGKVVIVNSKTPNAACLPGGYMIISEGMIDAINTEIQLLRNKGIEIDFDSMIAAVMGHELGHDEGRHSAQKIELMLAIKAIFFGLKTYYNHKKSIDKQPEEPKKENPSDKTFDYLEEITHFFLGKAKTRQGENEADLYSLILMARSGKYNLDATIYIQDLLEKHDPTPKNQKIKSLAALFRSHPHCKDRKDKNISNIEKVRKKEINIEPIKI